MLFGNIVFADEITNKCYVSTIKNEKYDSYIREKALDYIFSQTDEYVLNHLYIKEGITVNSDDDIEMIIYPVYYDNKLISTIDLFDVNGIIGGAYSENNVDILNKLFSMTERNKPLDIYKIKGTLYGVVGETAFRFDGERINVNELETEFEHKNQAVALDRLFNGNDFIQRSGSGYCVWTVYESSYNLGGLCGPMSLWNLQKNMGWNYFSSSLNLANDIAGVIGHASWIMDLDEMDDYLSQRNYTFTPHLTYMTVSQIHNMTYVNHKYGLAFSRISSTGAGHITAIIGYSSTSTSDYAILFDPHGSGNCRITLNLSTRTFVSGSNTYFWNYGALSNIYHS